jgi:hypothetical protein
MWVVMAACRTDGPGVGPGYSVCGAIARAASRKHAGHKQSSPEPDAGIGRRKLSSAHQQWPTVLPHANAAPQRAQVRRRSCAT